MATAASYELENGTVVVQNTYYIEKSAEELEKLRETARDMAIKIVYQEQMQREG